MAMIETPAVPLPRPVCKKCGKDNPNPKDVLPLVPGTKPKKFADKPEFWCGMCRFNYMGAWKYPPKKG